MKSMGLAIALVCAMSAFTFADAQNGGENSYVPRSERESDSVMTFKGSGKGLVIINHETGEVTRYTTKRQKAIHRMSPEAEASARSAWESRQEVVAEFEEEAAAQSAAESETPDDAGAEDGGEESAPAEAEKSEKPEAASDEDENE
jgi:hypothetical protein